MIGLRGKLAAKPGRANPWRILIARAVRHKRFISDGHEIVGRFSTGSTAAKDIFAHRLFALETEVLQDDRLVQNSRRFLPKGSRKLDLGASLGEDEGGIERATNAATLMMTHLPSRAYVIVRMIPLRAQIVVNFFRA